MQDKQKKFHSVLLGQETLEAIQGPLSPKWRKELTVWEKLTCFKDTDTCDGVGVHAHTPLASLGLL